MSKQRQRTAVVTGVSSGLGRMTAERLVDRGWDVLGTVRSPVEALGFDTVQLDVTDDEGVERLGRLAEERWGRLDALINNAGTAVLGPVEEMTSAELRRNLDVNLVAPMALVRVCLPLLRSAGGVVVQVSSVSGFTAFGLFSAYHASKWGLEGGTEALLEEVRSQGVRVVLLEPGSFRTEIAAKALMVAGRGKTGLYESGWLRVDEFQDWLHNDSPLPSGCVDAIVAAASRADAPLRVPLGDGAVEQLRQRAASYLAAADEAEAFLASVRDI